MEFTSIEQGQTIRMRRPAGKWITIKVTRVDYRFESATLFSGWRVVRGNTTCVVGKANRFGEYRIEPKFYSANRHTEIEEVAEDES